MTPEIREGMARKLLCRRVSRYQKIFRRGEECAPANRRMQKNR